jgi:fatty acid desaturase
MQQHTTPRKDHQRGGDVTVLLRYSAHSDGGRAMGTTRDFSHIDVRGFAAEVKALRKEADAALGPDDIAHMRKLELAATACSALGYATGWLLPNPLSALLMSTGQTARWTILMHHVGHRAFDHVPGAPARWKSTRFAQGARRFLDFPDWMAPAGWVQEHNVLHHSNTGDMGDPDLVERDVEWLRKMKVPTWLKYLSMVYFSASWKLGYYVPRTMRSLQYARARREDNIGPSVASTGGKASCDYPYDTRSLAPRQGTFSPLNPRGREVWWRCLLPYVLYRFVLLPALFLPLGQFAALSVLINSLMAEVFTNIHSFLVIAPNHAGDDVYRFDTPIHDRSEWVLRQVLGSANCGTGHPVGDFLQGYLNYQIEHHVWPDLTPYRYTQLQPRLKALCEKYGIPYVQQPVHKRVAKLFRIMAGAASMPTAVTPSLRAAATSQPNATTSTAAA